MISFDVKEELEALENDDKASNPLRSEPLSAAEKGAGKEVFTTPENAGEKSRLDKLNLISSKIASGARSFLWAEYRVLSIFCFIFGLLVLLLIGSGGMCGEPKFIRKVADITQKCDELKPLPGCYWEKNSGGCWPRGIFSMVAFFIGAITSVASGYFGMAIAVFANVRTAVKCLFGWTDGFNTAFRAGSVMGFTLVSLGLIVLYTLILLFNLQFKFDDEKFPHNNAQILFETIAGYGLGGSCVALFCRVGGGIYTKAADVGADLVGKTEQGIPEDDPRNPATIADNVGDNVGDIAGMGADLFGSFAEATCACLVIASTSPDLNSNWTSLMFPLLITATGIVVSLLTSILATDIPGLKVTKESSVERNLKIQLVVSTFLMTPLLYALCVVALPGASINGGKGFCTEVYSYSHYVDRTKNDDMTLCGRYTTPLQAYVCLLTGLWSGLIIGFWTEYMTSYSYKPVLDIAKASKSGAGTNIIYGLAAGYSSVVVPTFCLAITIFTSFQLGHMYGISLASLGMLSTLCTCLTIDGYGPITDNAGGIAEMAHLPSVARERTDVLDAAGNTTAAIGKGFAIGSAALVSLALFGAFVTEAQIQDQISILDPLTFSFLLLGSMLPIWFSAMTIRSVGEAADVMVQEVRRQFKNPKILDGTEEPDSDKCVEICTKAALTQMIPPAALVLFAPLITGMLFGVRAVVGLLAGSLVTGVQIAISSSNSGGAWDNAKKYIEKQKADGGGKGSDWHKAAVVGDTVGDPLKDTSGPSLNILMKLMAIISLVFATFFAEYSFFFRTANNVSAS